MRFIIERERVQAPVVVSVQTDNDAHIALYYNDIKVGWWDNGDGTLNMICITDSSRVRVL